MGNQGIFIVTQLRHGAETERATRREKNFEYFQNNFVSVTDINLNFNVILSVFLSGKLFMAFQDHVN